MVHRGGWLSFTRETAKSTARKIQATRASRSWKRIVDRETENDEQREREREQRRYTYIYMYIEIERESERKRVLAENRKQSVVS